jgi:hypothetical protein
MRAGGSEECDVPIFRCRLVLPTKSLPIPTWQRTARLRRNSVHVVLIASAHPPRSVFSSLLAIHDIRTWLTPREHHLIASETRLTLVVEHVSAMEMGRTRQEGPCSRHRSRSTALTIARTPLRCPDPLRPYAPDGPDLARFRTARA